MGSLIFGRVSGYLRRTTAGGILRRSARLISSCCGEPSPRLISPSPCPSPWLMLPPSKDAGGEGVVMLDNFYIPAHNKLGRIGGGGLVAADDDTYEVVGSSHGYVTLYNVCSRGREFFLWNPVSGERINLPPIDTLPYNDNRNLEGGYGGCVSKVIVSDPDCNVVAMSYGPALRLAFWCPGRTAEWTPIGAPFHNPGGGKEAYARDYQDLAYSIRQNRLFCITQYAELERWDLDDPQSPRIECSTDFDDVAEDPTLNMKYMVVEERSNQVFVVERIMMEKGGMFETVGFDVYKVVEEELELEEGGRKVVMKTHYVEEGSLGGLVMFVGINHCFALPAADYPELIPDSIYFTACHIYSDRYEIGIFNYNDETISPCFYPSTPPPPPPPPHYEDHIRRRTSTPGPFWFTPTPTAAIN